MPIFLLVNGNEPQKSFSKSRSFLIILTHLRIVNLLTFAVERDGNFGSLLTSIQAKTAFIGIGDSLRRADRLVDRRTFLRTDTGSIVAVGAVPADNVFAHIAHAFERHGNVLLASTGTESQLAFICIGVAITPTDRVLILKQKA